MNQLIKMSVVVGPILALNVAQAATVVPDGRGNGMGNTGVTSADYVLAPFYNPAMVAIHRGSDRFGLLIPSIGANLRDKDESIDTLDDLQDSIEAFENGDLSQADQLNGYLNELYDNRPFAVNAGVGISVAFPVNALSVNVFSRGYVEIFAAPDIAEDGGNNPSDVTDRYEASNVDMVAFGYVEVGVAFAKRITVRGQDISVGISPKYQQLRTYKQNLSVKDYDLSDYDESETNENAINFDLGAVWSIDNYRLGVAVKDLISQEIDTQEIVGVDSYTYELNTQVTVSGSYDIEYLVTSIDLDLTKQKRFSGVSDDTQFLRLGIEGNAFGWGQLRGGYQIDIEDTLDEMFTLGLGISPGDLVSIDLAGNYAGDSQYGISGNLSFTF